MLFSLNSLIKKDELNIFIIYEMGSTNKNEKNAMHELAARITYAGTSTAAAAALLLLSFFLEVEFRYVGNLNIAISF